MKQHCNFTGGNESYCEICDFNARWARGERRDMLRTLAFLLALASPLFLILGALILPEALDVALLALVTGVFATMATGFVAHEWMR